MPVAFRIRRSFVRRVVIAGLLAGLFAVPSSRAATFGVEIVNFRFVPPTVTIAVGDTVTWTNRDGAPHDATDVVNRPPLFATELLDRDESGSVVFDAPGMYDYFCSIHPGMRGTVIVQAAEFTDFVYLPTIAR